MPVPADDPAEQHAVEVMAFKDRVFSGHDLLQILDQEGIGVGAAMFLVERVDAQAANDLTVRDLTFAPTLTVPDVLEALKVLMGQTQRLRAVGSPRYARDDAS